MTKAYVLTEPLEVEYIWDRGPRPSGYAHVKLRLVPRDVEHGESLAVEAQSETIWRIRPAPGKNTSLTTPKTQDVLQEFRAKFIEGLREGVQAALASTLDKPIIGVTVILVLATVDGTYSTQMAFYFAARAAIEQILKDIDGKHLLKEYGE